MTRYTTQRSAHCENILSLVSFRTVPGSGCNAAAIYVLGGACIKCRTIRKLGPRFLFLNQSYDTIHEGTGACLVAYGTVMIGETTDAWTTSSCNLLQGPTGSARAWSCIDKFPLIIDGCCPHPALWHRGIVNSQLISSSLSHMVLGGPPLNV